MSSQSTVTDRDVHAMLAITRAYTDEEDDTGGGLPWQLLHDLRDLVECDQLAVSGQDTQKWDFFVEQEVPRIIFSSADLEAYEETYREHYWTSTCSLPDRMNDPTLVFRDSDVLSPEAARHDAMHIDLLHPAGQVHEIMVCLDAGGPQRTVRLLFARGPGADFSDRDLAVLTLLRPHLQTAYDTAERRRRGVAPLTARQRVVMRHVAAGYTNAQIARRMDISPATVRKHLENVFARLDVDNRGAAVAEVSRLL